MKINLKRINENMLLEAENADGKKILIDAKEKDGGDNLSATPIEMLLMALGGCSSIDVISILKKQRQQIDDYSVENAERLSFADHQFDFAFCREAYHHMPRPSPG